MLNYKKPVKVPRRKTVIAENEQVTIAPADTKTQVIKAGNKTIGTVSNPTVANQLKTAIQKGEVNLNQDLKEEAPPEQEQWVKDNKEKFIKQYGKKGEAILYATAWQRHNDGVKESKRSELDKIFESVAFDEPDPVSHILSKFKFEVNQFCQGQQINPDLYDCLYDYYLDAGLMPYGVAKARDANPIEWVSSKLKEYLGQCGVSQQPSQPLDSQAEVQNEQPVPEYGDDVEQSVSPETGIDDLLESSNQDDAFRLVRQACNDVLVRGGWLGYAKETDRSGLQSVRFSTKDGNGFVTVFETPTKTTIVANGKKFKTAGIKFTYRVNDKTKQSGDIVDVAKFKQTLQTIVTDAKELTEQEIDQMFESILGKPLTSKIKESKMKKSLVLEAIAQDQIDEFNDTLNKGIFAKYSIAGFASNARGPNTISVVIRSGKIDFISNVIENAPDSMKGDALKKNVKRIKQFELDTKQLGTQLSGAALKCVKEIFDLCKKQFGTRAGVAISIGGAGKPYTFTGTISESSIDRKSKLMEAVDPKSVYMVVKNVPRLRGIKCDIGITYELSYDPDDDVFSAVAVKFVDMETGKKYAQTQFQELAYKQLMLFADKDATKRANDNDLEPQDFSESGRQKPIVKEILKASKTVTRDFFANVSESSIDRKARQLVDSWNLKLKQKLKESPEYKQGDSVTLGSGFLKGKKAKIVKIDGQWLEVNPTGEAKDFVIKVKKSDLVESTQKRKLREGVSISTSQSQGFGYDEIDGNTSINVCATGEDAVRLAEILRDAGYGQFKLDHIAVPQKAIVGDYHDDAGEVQQPEYDPMPEYDETQPEADYDADHVDGDDESQLLDRIKQFVSYGAESPVEEITEAEEMEDSEVVVYDGKLGIIVDTDTGADNEYEVMFADGTEVISGTDLEPATQAQINASKDIVKYVGDDAHFAGRYGVIIEEDGDEYHVAFSDGETWIVGTDLEAPALQESFANEYQMNEPAQTNYMTHGISGGLNSLRRSQATGNVTRISTMESKGKGRKMLKESKQTVGKPSDELASMANLVEAISVQQRIKFGG